MICGLGLSVFEPRRVPDFYGGRLFIQIDNRPAAMLTLIVFSFAGFVFASLTLSVLVVSVQQLNALASRHYAVTK